MKPISTQSFIKPWTTAVTLPFFVACLSWWLLPLVVIALPV